MPKSFSAVQRTAPVPWRAPGTPDTRVAIMGAGYWVKKVVRTSTPSARLPPSAMVTTPPSTASVPGAHDWCTLSYR